MYKILLLTTIMLLFVFYIPQSFSESIEYSSWSETAQLVIDEKGGKTSVSLGVMSKNPDDIILPAVNGLKRCIASAVKNKVKRFVMTSSFAAIGSGTKNKTTFDDNPQRIGINAINNISARIICNPILSTILAKFIQSS